VQRETESEIAAGLKEQAGIEADIERAKENLAMKPDFNLYDAFRHIDTKSYGNVNALELKYALEDMGVYAHMDEIDLFFSRYDKNRNGRISFSEFCDAFSPADAYYASMLNRRSSNSAYPAFSYSTTCDFKEAWRTHFRCEASHERLRQRLRRNPYFNSHEAFKACDIDENGKISKFEVRNLMESKGFHVT
jgi:Ca2+-binding EF-hand superfamily protein